MRIILTTLLMLIQINIAYAAPYMCASNGATYMDSNQCSLSCGMGCDELTQSTSSSSCDTSQYQGFFTYNNNTYAVTKSDVNHSTSNIKITSSDENQLIADMLKSLGIDRAWISLSDTNQSTKYNTSDIDRFTWYDGASVTYSNFAANEPSNSFSSSDVGTLSIYGEHWVVISSDGTWSDIGYTSSGLPQLPAVVKFSGVQDCVSGTVSSSSSGVTFSDLKCTDGNTGSDGLISFATCEEGIVFGDSSTASLCPTDKVACNKSITTEEVCSPTTETKTYTFEGVIRLTPYGDTVQLSGATIVYHGTGNNNIDYSNQIEGTVISSVLKINGFDMIFNDGDGSGVPYSTPAITISNNSSYTYTLSYGYTQFHMQYPSGTPSYTLTVTTEVTHPNCVTNEIVDYTCPHSGRPCIASDDGYYCSPTDCADSTSGFTSTDTDESIEGANDYNNNGEIDEDGNCMGEIIIFAGNDKRCRQAGTQTSFFQCCKSMTAAELEDYSGFDLDFCTATEKQVWVQSANESCYEVGSYCTEKWLGKYCVQEKTTHCCFNDKFTLAFVTAGKDLLGQSWGTPESPQCGGFTPEELQMLGSMGISSHPAMIAYAEGMSEDFQNNFNIEDTINPDSVQQQIVDDLGDIQ